MAKYLISWTEEDWYNVEIEAESHKEALDKFWNRDYDSESVKHIGSEFQDSLEIEEL